MSEENVNVDVEKRAAEGIQQLTKLWGKDYDTNINAAKKAWYEFAPSDFDIERQGNDPDVIRLLAAVGLKLNNQLN